MKNIISSFKSTFKNVSNVVKNSIDSLRFWTKAKVWAVLAAWVIWLSSTASASENWVMVDKAGMWPWEFSQKYFWTSNWKLLRDRDWNLIKNPRTDFILWREYTIFLSDSKKEVNLELSSKTEKVKNNTEIVELKSQEQDNSSKKEEKQTNVVRNREEDIKVKKVWDKNYYVIPEETYPSEVKEFVAKYNFDYEAFVNSVIQKESKWKTSAINGWTNAVWLIQFLPDTLIWEWYNKWWKLTKEMLKEFKRSVSLQFKYIHKYNAKTFKIISQNPELIDRELKKGKDISTILVEFWAEANFAWHRSIWRWWKWSDWKTSIPDYKKDVVSYFREFLAANDEKYDSNTKVASIKPEKTITSIETAKVWDLASTDLWVDNSPKLQKVSMVDTNNAVNDRFFSDMVSDISSKTVISDTIKDTETRIKDVISNIWDDSMRESIEIKIADSKTTSIQYLYDNLSHFTKKSSDLQKLSKSSIWMEYDRIMQEKKKVDSAISKLTRIISYAEWKEAQRKAA